MSFRLSIIHYIYTENKNCIICDKTLHLDDIFYSVKYMNNMSDYCDKCFNHSLINFDNFNSLTFFIQKNYNNMNNFMHMYAFLFTHMKVSSIDKFSHTIHIPYIDITKYLVIKDNKINSTSKGAHKGSIN